jgi:outer membrane murein-binding lipoprotein Lpp
MKYTIVWVIIGALLVTGCQKKQEDQAAHDAKVAQQAREALLKELKAKQEAQKKKEHFSKIGIARTPDGKIIIDTNRTTHYFRSIAEQMKAKADKLAADLQKGMVDEKEAGIEINNSRISIDLNKTESFLQKWTKKMEGVVKEMNSVAKGIEYDINESIEVK